MYEKIGYAYGYRLLTSDFCLLTSVFCLLSPNLPLKIPYGKKSIIYFHLFFDIVKYNL